MAQDKYGYVPAGIQRQMDQHMQNMPAHLKQYQGGNKYIPQKAANEMASYMQKTMPAHMQEYINPYMERQTQAGLNSLDPGTPRTVHERAPAPNLMRRDHAAFGEQFSVDTDAAHNSGSLSFSPQYSPQQSAPSPAPPPISPAANSQTPYDFIMENPPKASGGIFGSGGSKKTRIIIVAAGVLILLMLLFIVVSLITSSGKSGTQNLVNLAEEQNEIIRVADMGVAKARTGDAKNLASITELTFRSTQNDTIKLLSSRGHKLKGKQLELKHDANTDSQLKTAELNNNFDEAFTKIMNDELLTYQGHVKTAFDSSTSKSEQSVLKSSYNSVTLLLGGKPPQSN